MIEVVYNDKAYKFGFSRQTASNAEREGFVAEELGNKPALMIPILVYHAATTYNTGIRRKLVDEIFEDISDKEGFIAALIEEYAEPVQTLFSNKESGNSTWKRV